MEMDGSKNGHRPLYGDAFNDYMYEVRLLEKGRDLSREEKSLIEDLASNGDIESRQRLILMYLPYVVSIARKYYFPGRLANMDPLDLVQEGNCGLMQAVITFRSGRASFISYAHSRVEGQIKDAIRKVITDKGAPRRIQTLHRRITETTMALYEVYRRLPTNEEIANHLQVHLDEVVEATQVMAMLTKGHYPIDTSIEVARGESRSIEEIIEDFNATDPLESAIRREQQKEIREVMNEILNPRERFLLALYYNLTDDKKQWVWRELGKELGISESRAVQIAHRALAKLSQHPKVAAWWAKLPKIDKNVQTSLTVFEMERREEDAERRSIYRDLKNRTILFDEIKGQDHWS